jgi:hypothetical protein
MEAEIFTETSVGFCTTGRHVPKAELFIFTTVRSPFPWDTMLYLRWYTSFESNRDYISILQSVCGFVCFRCWLVLSSSSCKSTSLNYNLWREKGKRLSLAGLPNWKKRRKGNFRFLTGIYRKKNGWGPRRGISQNVWLLLVPISRVVLKSHNLSPKKQWYSEIYTIKM